MTAQELREEISIELEYLETVVHELDALRSDLGDRQPTVREKTAAGAFLAQFYAGIENILKRVSHFHALEIPAGESWHIELFQRFCEPSRQPLPILFNAELAQSLRPFRKFRHVVYHGYGFQLDWSRMREGVFRIDAVFHSFKESLNRYLLDLAK